MENTSVWVLCHLYDGIPQIEVYRHQLDAIKAAAEITMEYIGDPRYSQPATDNDPSVKAARDAMSRQDYAGVLSAIAVYDLDDYCSLEVKEHELR